MKLRLDQELVRRGVVASRSQAENYIRLGEVSVDGRAIMKPGFFVSENSEIKLNQDEQFVSRAALKLKSVAEKLKIDFTNKIVLDIGSSTGGFTEFALSRGAQKVIAIDVGTNQLHPKLRGRSDIELHEKTDIRDVVSSDASRFEPRQSSDRNGVGQNGEKERAIIQSLDLILADVSFISLREILPHVAQNLCGRDTEIIAMVKPQFETGNRVKNAGVIKNDTERRKILHDFEIWARQYFIVKDKADSEIKGANGNQERFYLLRRLK
ncbi:TlyA family RNA methyltransferase [Candidatus Saccharibacteria bacterium]|nr:TlyA family RNA methyltransferase [Candidatus Saccharibacteria bacterium]MCL1962890.1 TlyA family RNA methyltransferase [Candidatus Saccharibacteria bacterium]